MRWNAFASESAHVGAHWNEVEFCYAMNSTKKNEMVGGRSVEVCFAVAVLAIQGCKKLPLRSGAVLRVACNPPVTLKHGENTIREG